MDDKNPNPNQPAKQQTGKSPNPRRWNVLVRHSTFLLKQAVVEAMTSEEAKAIFLRQVEAKHQAKSAKAASMPSPDAHKAAQAILDAYKLGVEQQGKLEWDIRPAEEVEAQRAAIIAERKRIWDRRPQEATAR